VPKGLYSATISSTPLKVRETRLVAELLLSGPMPEPEWKAAILERNILQIHSPIAAIRFANILRARLRFLTPEAWTMIRDGDQVLSAQTALAGAIKHSQLVGDFLDIIIREQRAQFATELSPAVWAGFIEGCHGRDPEMPEWTTSTLSRLRSTVFTILTEAGYLESTRSLKLQTVFVDLDLVSYLKQQDEHYVLRCMQVME
jgi:hypothetical protein